MKIGYVCPDYEMQKYAGRLGFDGVELYLCGENSLDTDITTDDQAAALYHDLKSRGVNVLSLQYIKDYAQAFDGDVKKAIASLGRAIDIVKLLGANILSVNCWFDPGDKGHADCYIKTIYSELGDMAEAKGVWVAIENCPHGGHNYVNSPDTMRRFAGLVDKAHVGLEFDPSHMVWLGCDYVEAVREFCGRIFAVHAKDTEIIERKLKNVGIRGSGWWRYRIPGWGAVDWRAMFTELLAGGFDGPVIIEHEDPIFDGAFREAGLAKGRDFLRSLLI